MDAVDYLSKRYPKRGGKAAAYSKTEVLQMLEECANQKSVQVMPETAGIIRTEINANDFTYFINTCLRINENVPNDEVWVIHPDGRKQKFIIID